MSRDIYAEVTATIIESLEAMQAGKWTKPWADIWSHRNGESGRPYNGVNVWLLSYAAFKNDWSSNLWVTFKQAKALAEEHGGQGVLKGSKGTLVTLWKPFDAKVKDENGKVVKGENGKPKTRRAMLLRHFTVFNREQTGLPAAAWEKFEMKPNRDLGTFEDLEATLAAIGCPVQTGVGDKAAYFPSFDRIEMPPKEFFKSTEGYYATLAHEHIHATGHKDRCDRDLKGRFDLMAYAMEELVAELGAAYLCAEFGVTGQGLQHPQYIGHWLKVLKGDDKAIFTAASKAKEAVRFIHAEKATLDEEMDTEAA